MSDDGDFSNITSLGEIRADKSRDCKDWSPRDALIYILGQIDRGEIAPDCLMVIYDRKDKKGEEELGFTQAGPSWLKRLGLLQTAINEILNPDADD